MSYTCRKDILEGRQKSEPVRKERSRHVSATREDCSHPLTSVTSQIWFVFKVTLAGQKIKITYLQSCAHLAQELTHLVAKVRGQCDVSQNLPWHEGSQTHCVPSALAWERSKGNVIGSRSIYRLSHRLLSEASCYTLFNCYLLICILTRLFLTESLCWMHVNVCNQASQTPL